MTSNLNVAETEGGHVPIRAILVVTVLLCGCAGDRAGPGGPAAYDPELAVYLRCLQDKVSIVVKEPGADDALALSAVAKCSNENLALEKAIAANLSPQMADRAVAVFRDQSMKTTLRWIVQARKRPNQRS